MRYKGAIRIAHEIIADMRKVHYFPFLLLMIFLLLSLSISPIKSDHLRGMVLSSFIPKSNGVKVKPASIHPAEKELSELRLENQLLHAQMDAVYEWLLFQQRIDEQVERLQEFSQEKHQDFYWKDFLLRRSDELKQILESEHQALPAKVVYREPITWSSSLWINVGESDNERLGRFIVGKNSPVVMGESLIGLVDYVGKTHSRIRLITDAGLTPSVRVQRGSSQDRFLLQILQAFQGHLNRRADLFETAEEKEFFSANLHELMLRLIEKRADIYLAKGELRGSSHPLWRSQGQLLKGKGFNYDYPDEEGPSRDLRTGRRLGDASSAPLAMIQEGDLLVTTGMDGVFPAGLKVASVEKVEPLREGDYSYEILARPTAWNVNDLDVVFVLPPLPFSKQVEEPK